MRCESADFIEARSSSTGCNKAEYKAAAHPVCLNTRKLLQTGRVHIRRHIMASLTLRGISKRYEETEVMKGVNLDITTASSSCSSARRGCGKSTLLRMIAGLEDISGGELMIDGTRVNDTAAREARHRDGVPVLRALSAHDACTTTWRSASSSRARRRPTIDAAREAGGEDPAHRAPARSQAEAAVGRPAPARRDRPRHRAQAEGVPVRRAALQPRRRAAREDAPRDSRGCTTNSRRR